MDEVERFETVVEDSTFARMMIDAYDKWGHYMTDYYLATPSMALDLLLNGEIIVCDGKMIKLASKRLVKIYDKEARDFQ